jgi:hypothetical protein
MSKEPKQFSMAALRDQWIADVMSDMQPDEIIGMLSWFQNAEPFMHDVRAATERLIDCRVVEPLERYMQGCKISTLPMPGCAVCCGPTRICANIHRAETWLSYLCPEHGKVADLWIIKLWCEAALPLSRMRDGEQEFEIWTEGCATTCVPSEATFHGKFVAPTFHDAVAQWRDTLEDERSRSLVNLDNLTFSGCRLFDNEVEARKSDG